MDDAAQAWQFPVRSQLRQRCQPTPQGGACQSRRDQPAAPATVSSNRCPSHSTQAWPSTPCAPGRTPMWSCGSRPLARIHHQSARLRARQRVSGMRRASRASDAARACQRPASLSTRLPAGTRRASMRCAVPKPRSAIKARTNDRRHAPDTSARRSSRRMARQRCHKLRSSLRVLCTCHSPDSPAPCPRRQLYCHAKQATPQTR